MILLALANLPTPPWPDAPSPQELPELVRRAAEGDVRAFERLVVQYQGKVRSFARSFAPDHDEAADLAQEALVKVYRSIGSFRFESSFTTWLFRIVKNTFLDAVKSRLGVATDAKVTVVTYVEPMSWMERMLLRSLREGGMTKLATRLTGALAPAGQGPAGEALDLLAGGVLPALREDGTLAAAALLDGRPLALMPMSIRVR